jgi:hypothetical protein
MTEAGRVLMTELEKQLDRANIWLYLIVNKIKNINETLKEEQKI